MLKYQFYHDIEAFKLESVTINLSSGSKLGDRPPLEALYSIWGALHSQHAAGLKILLLIASLLNKEANYILQSANGGIYEVND